MGVMTPNVPGAESVVDWFGKWPSFHDAEIMTLHIDRERSSIRIYTFARSDRIGVDGSFVREREAVVVFEFTGIRLLRIEGEDADGQNVIAALMIEQTNEGYRLDLSPCYGLSGEIYVKELRVRLESTFHP